MSSILVLDKMYKTHSKISTRLPNFTKTVSKSLFNTRPEEPVVVICARDNVNLIGPPDRVSNLRPIILKRDSKETPLQQRLAELQNATQLWNHNFWTVHNVNFKKERELFIQRHNEAIGEDRTLTADEMSEFYKDFLNKHWSTHVNYNVEWYRRNLTLLYLAFRVNIEKKIF